MTPQIFDRALVLTRRLRAERVGARPSVLMARAADDLADRLSATLRRFECAVDIGSEGPEALAALKAAASVGDALRFDRIPGPGVAAVADPEMLPLGAASVDLIVSLLSLQTLNDLPGALVQIRRALRPDGLFLAALIGGRSLHELREAFMQAELEIEGGVSPRVAPFADVRDMGGLLQRAGFALPVTDVDSFSVRYSSAAGLLDDLRALGATNPLAARRRTPLKRATLSCALALYDQRFRDADGRIPATVEIVWVSGWAPHDSQQKPLKPGSVKARLADALRVPEQGAGEKAGR
jgi:SAM-dependent methyltransferase